MGTHDALFLGSPSGGRRELPFHLILDHHATLRDSIAGTSHVASTNLAETVCDASFIYCFNAYKAIELLLPELYHESAAVILRQLWEVSLNLHWIGEQVDERVKDFCNFTVMEYRRMLQKAGEAAELGDFDKATDVFQKRFRFDDSKGRERTHSNFATLSVFDRAVALGDPWKREYELVYNLASMHAHGAPGAILHAVFMQAYSDSEIRERNSAAIIALLSMEVMARNVELLVKLKIIPDASDALNAYAEFEKAFKLTLGDQNAEKDGAQLET